MNKTAPAPNALPCCCVCGRKLTSGKGTISTLGLIGPECVQKDEVREIERLLAALPGTVVARGNLQRTGAALNAVRALGLQVAHSDVDGGWQLGAVRVDAPTPRPARVVIGRYRNGRDRLLDTLGTAFPAMQVRL